MPGCPEVGVVEFFTQLAVPARSTAQAQHVTSRGLDFGAVPNMRVSRRRERVYLALCVLTTVGILMAENLLPKTKNNISGENVGCT